ncbi:MAG: hypothetical protein J6T39_02825, partial [Clostridia bacterium]|nr:hypothetical protein [Clostridia bacterium]
LSYVLSAAIVLIFVLFFTSVFGLTAPMHRVCVIDITEVMPRLLNQARFNWLVYFTFPIALVLGLGVFASCLSMSIESCVREKLKSKNTISTIIMIGLVFCVAVIFKFTYTPFYQFVSTIFVYYNTVVQYALPILILVMISILDTKKYKKAQKNIKKAGKTIKKQPIFQKN